MISTKISMKNHGEIHISTNNLVHNVLLQSLPFKSKDYDVYFLKPFKLGTMFSTSPIFVII